MLDDMNLNLLLTFFWLSLSAGIILPGIWLLTDCKTNLSIINPIIQQLSTEDDIPKSYFIHFYLIGIFANVYLLINNLSSFFLLILFIIYISRRLYECIYFYKLNSQMKRENIFHYFYGLIYYPCVGLTIIIDKKYPYTNISLIKYLFALIIFFNANYIQHMTKLNSHYWIFNYLSCPNFLTDIFIYISFFLASHRTSAMTSLIVWVFIHQSLSTLLKPPKNLTFHFNPSKSN